MRPKHITYTIAAGAATAIGLAQTKAGAGALAINGLLAVSGVATLPIPRHIKIAAVADEHLITFTVTGTDRYGNALTEAVTGPAAGITVSTTKNFKTVTGISVGAALTGNVTLGTGDSLETGWIPLDVPHHIWDCGYKVSSGGAANVEVQTTIGDVFSAAEWDLPIDGALGFAIGMPTATAVRLKITGHVSGNVTFDIIHRRD
jgi:hypothetical protein